VRKKEGEREGEGEEKGGGECACATYRLHSWHSPSAYNSGRTSTCRKSEWERENEWGGRREREEERKSERGRWRDGEYVGILMIHAYEYMGIQIIRIACNPEDTHVLSLSRSFSSWSASQDYRRCVLQAKRIRFAHTHTYTHTYIYTHVYASPAIRTVCNPEIP